MGPVRAWNGIFLKKVVMEDTPFGKDFSEEKKDQQIRSLWNVLGMFLWLKIAQNEIQQLALFEIAASMHSPFCPYVADLAACVLLALQKGCAR